MDLKSQLITLARTNTRLASRLDDVEVLLNYNDDQLDQRRTSTEAETVVAKLAARELVKRRAEKIFVALIAVNLGMVLLTMKADLFGGASWFPVWIYVLVCGMTVAIWAITQLHYVGPRIDSLQSELSAAQARADFVTLLPPERRTQAVELIGVSRSAADWHRLVVGKAARRPRNGDVWVMEQLRAVDVLEARRAADQAMCRQLHIAQS